MFGFRCNSTRHVLLLCDPCRAALKMTWSLSFSPSPSSSSSSLSPSPSPLFPLLVLIYPINLLTLTVLLKSFHGSSKSLSGSPDSLALEVPCSLPPTVTFPAWLAPFCSRSSLSGQTNLLTAHKLPCICVPLLNDFPVSLCLLQLFPFLSPYHSWNPHWPVKVLPLDSFSDSIPFIHCFLTAHFCPGV